MKNGAGVLSHGDFRDIAPLADAFVVFAEDAFVFPFGGGGGEGFGVDVAGAGVEGNDGFEGGGICAGGFVADDAEGFADVLGAAGKGAQPLGS